MIKCILFILPLLAHGFLERSQGFDAAYAYVPNLLSANAPIQPDRSAQCNGRTKKGKQCRNVTNNPIGYCHLHQHQASSHGIVYAFTPPADITINPHEKERNKQCTGVTKKGNRCKRMTHDSNGRCFQHQSP